MEDRRSVRAFLDKPISRAQVEEILDCARLAPSAINLQPWEFVVVYGEEKERLIRRLMKAHAEQKVSCGAGTTAPLPERFVKRSRIVLQGLKPYLATQGMEFNRFIEEGSCSFYGAPVVIIVTMDSMFPSRRYLDVGLAVSYLLLAAHAKGVATCPVGLITAYADDIRDVLDIQEEKEVLLAIALGFRDDASPLNSLKTTREPLDVIRRWYE
jgi:nitroreductase